jgi:hypothetical protein
MTADSGPLFFIFAMLNGRDGLDCLGQRSRAGYQFPGSGALDEPTGSPFLARGSQQLLIECPKLTFPIIVGARQIRDVIGMKQATLVIVGGFF